MKNATDDRFAPLEINDCVTLQIPEVDRGPLDFPNILGIIVDKKHDLYQIATKDETVKGWYPRTDIGLEQKLMTLEDVPETASLTLR